MVGVSLPYCVAARGMCAAACIAIFHYHSRSLECRGSAVFLKVFLSQPRDRRTLSCTTPHELLTCTTALFPVSSSSSSAAAGRFRMFPRRSFFANIALCVRPPRSARCVSAQHPWRAHRWLGPATAQRLHEWRGWGMGAGRRDHNGVALPKPAKTRWLSFRPTTSLGR